MFLSPAIGDCGNWSLCSTAKVLLTIHQELYLGFFMKTGRNDPCPCVSGKKYKVCCLKKDQTPPRKTGIT